MNLSGRRRHADMGFTLIELIVVIIVTGIIATVGSRILITGFDAYTTGKDLVELEWQGGLALERLSRDLRLVRSATSADLNISQPDRIRFRDINANQVRYSLSGTTLMRNNQPLADDISSLDFSYLMNDGKTTAATSTSVYYIVVTLQTARNNLGYTLRAVIHPRQFQ